MRQTGSEWSMARTESSESSEGKQSIQEYSHASHSQKQIKTLSAEAFRHIEDFCWEAERDRVSEKIEEECWKWDIVVWITSGN